MDDPGNKVIGAQTAERAIRLLLLAVESDEPLGLSELARVAGLSKAGTYRLMQALVAHQFLEREPEGRKYVIGSGLAALAGQVMRKLSIRTLAHPVMQRIANATGETVSLHIRHLQQHVCVEIIESTHEIRRVVPLGEMVSLFEGTASKAILSALPTDDLERLLMVAEAERRDTRKLVRDVEQARRQGYFAAVGDRVPGAGALSAPIFDWAGVRGSLTVSGPGDRFTAEVMVEVAEFVREECDTLSSLLGHARSPTSVGEV